jgi:hypothetical protein
MELVFNVRSTGNVVSSTALPMLHSRIIIIMTIICLLLFTSSYSLLHVRDCIHVWVYSASSRVVDVEEQGA